MKATLIAIKRHPTKENVILPCFRLENGKAAKTWLDTTYGNYRRWQPFLKVGVIIENFRMKSPGLIDADSAFTIVK